MKPKDQWDAMMFDRGAAVTAMQNPEKIASAFTFALTPQKWAFWMRYERGQNVGKGREALLEMIDAYDRDRRKKK